MKEDHPNRLSKAAPCQVLQADLPAAHQWLQSDLPSTGKRRDLQLSGTQEDLDANYAMSHLNSPFGVCSACCAQNRIWADRCGALELLIQTLLLTVVVPIAHDVVKAISNSLLLFALVPPWSSLRLEINQSHKLFASKEHSVRPVGASPRHFSIVQASLSSGNVIKGVISASSRLFNGNDR